MKLVNVTSVIDYENLFLFGMRVDLREKIQNSNIFVVAKLKDESDVISCNKVIMLKDSDGLCRTRNSFHEINFELISDDEISNYLPEYFIGKYICDVIK